MNFTVRIDYVDNFIYYPVVSVLSLVDLVFLYYATDRGSFESQVPILGFEMCLICNLQFEVME